MTISCSFVFSFFCETWRPTSEILGWTLSHHIGVADAAWVGSLVWNGCWLIQRHKSLFEEEGRSSLHPFGSCWTRYCSYLLVQVRPALQELSRTAYHRDVNPLVSKLRNSMIVLDSQWYLMILLQNWINNVAICYTREFNMFQITRNNPKPIWGGTS